MKGKTAGLRGVRWPDDGIKLPDFNARPYWAADMREAWMACYKWVSKDIAIGCWPGSINAEDEALRRWPDKEKK